MVARAVSWFQWHYRLGGNVHTNEVLSFSTKDKDFLIFFLDWMKNASFVLIGQRYCQGCWLVKYETILKHLRLIVTSLQGATRNIIFGSIVVTFNQCRFARNARNASKVRRALLGKQCKQSKLCRQCYQDYRLCESIFELFLVELRPAHFESDLPTIRWEVV